MILSCQRIRSERRKIRTMVLILFTDRAPHPLTMELMHHGDQVFEALAISEVYALADQHPLATIIISSHLPHIWFFLPLRPGRAFKFLSKPATWR